MVGNKPEVIYWLESFKFTSCSVSISISISFFDFIIGFLFSVVFSPWFNFLNFRSRAKSHHSFIFDSRFLYELKYKVFLSTSVWKFTFFFNQKHGVFDFKTSKFSEQSRMLLLPNLWFSSFNKNFSNSMISAWVGACQKLTWGRFF